MIRRSLHSTALLALLLPLAACTKLESRVGGGTDVHDYDGYDTTETATPTPTATSSTTATAIPTATPTATPSVTVTPTTIVLGPPPPPQNLLAPVTSPGAIRLSWTIAGGNTTGYRLAFSRGATFPADCLGGEYNYSFSDPALKAIDISGLEVSTQYAFRLCSVSGTTLSTTSVTALSSSSSSPGGPTDASGFKVDYAGHRELYLSWSAAPAPAVSYRIAGALGAMPPANCLGPSVATTTTTYHYSNLDPATKYSFRLCSVSSSGVVSAGVTLTDMTRGWKPGLGSVRPEARISHSAVWTGDRMLVWGGVAVSGAGIRNGGSYDPATNGWTLLGTSNAPAARSRHTAVWTGSRMIVWAGIGLSGSLRDGGSYDATTRLWSALPLTNAPAARHAHTAVWTGSKMLVWGGRVSTASTSVLADGGSYDPALAAWTSLPTTNAPSAREKHTAVWTGTKMIVWGGNDSVSARLDGKIYDPATNSWSAMKSASNARTGHTAIWTGTKMIVWGGVSGGVPVYGGESYDPATNEWTSLASGSPDGRTGHSAVWTGSAMVVYGGEVGTYSVDTGGIYKNDQWSATPYTDVPGTRLGHTAVWTGSLMIVWGGAEKRPGYVGYYDDGGVFAP